jgi:hypothetical protein
LSILQKKKFLSLALHIRGEKNDLGNENENEMLELRTMLKLVDFFSSVCCTFYKA